MYRPPNEPPIGAATGRVSDDGVRVIPRRTRDRVGFRETGWARGIGFSPRPPAHLQSLSVTPARKIPLLTDIAAGYESVAVIGTNPNDDSRYREDGFERMVELVKVGTVQYDAYLRDESKP